MSSPGGSLRERNLRAIRRLDRFNRQDGINWIAVTIVVVAGVMVAAMWLLTHAAAT